MNAPEHLEVIGDLLAIRWSDGSEDYLPVERLRAASPSAENTGERDLLGRSGMRTIFVVRRPIDAYVSLAKATALNAWRDIDLTPVKVKLDPGHFAGWMDEQERWYRHWAAWLERRAYPLPILRYETHLTMPPESVLRRFVGTAAQVGVTLHYDPAYRRLEYPGGDVPLDRGVCTDVVIRAFRPVGLDLQQAVHEDMQRAFAAYPHRWGLSRPDRVKAHKYLAFIACVSSQQLTCREEFGIALELDPKFDLAPAEAGHPIWGPVFKSVKAKQAKQP